MIYDREYAEKFIEKFVRPVSPEIEESLLKAFDAIETDTKVSFQVLETLADAASDRRAHVFDISTRFLAELAEQDERALGKIREMAASPHAHVRHNSILCLTTRIGPEICSEIIRGGLKDKSSIVRRKAADWAHRLLLTEVVPDIRVALKIESNSGVSDVMRDALSALKSR